MKQQEERIAMRSIKRLSNGISREMCAAFGSGMFSGAQGRTLHFLLAEHTKSDVFQKDIEAEFGLRPPTATALLKELEQRGLIRKEPVSYDARKKKIVVTEEALQVQRLRTQRPGGAESGSSLQGFPMRRCRSFFL